MINRKYLIIDESDLSKISYSMLVDKEYKHLKKSLDGKSYVIRWDGQDPDFIKSLKNLSEPLLREEIAVVVAGPIWTSPDGEINKECESCP
jgi:hypothetical protein